MPRGQNPAEDRFHKKEEREKNYRKQLPGDDDEALPPPVQPIHTESKLDRNAPCPCGSGKKYKKCCGKQ